MQDNAANEKIIDKIRKLFSLAESEKSIGNVGAAITIAEKARELLTKYKVDYAALSPQEKEETVYYVPTVGVTVVSNPFLRSNARTNLRMSWWEHLAKVIAEGYFCRVTVNEKTGNVSFYGLDMDREIAIFIFEQIAEFADNLAKVEMKKAKKSVGAKGVIAFGKKAEDVIAPPEFWVGDETFVDSFHRGFRSIIKERYFAEQKEISFASVDAFVKEEIERTSFKEYVRFQGYQSIQTEFLISDMESNINDWGLQIGERAGRHTVAKVGKTDQREATEALVRQQSLQPKKDNEKEIIFVIDDSGSMAGSKIDQARAGVSDNAEDATSKGYLIGLVAFADHGKRLVDVQNKPNGLFKEALSHIYGSGGSTNLSDGITVAQRMFRTRKGKRVIFIATDGMPNGYDSREKALATAREAKRQGIKIMAIGTNDCDQSFIDELVSEKGLGLLTSNAGFGEGIRKMRGLLSA